jgi:hypothetical protein
VKSGLKDTAVDEVKNAPTSPLVGLRQKPSALTPNSHEKQQSRLNRQSSRQQLGVYATFTKSQLSSLSFEKLSEGLPYLNALGISQSILI